MSYILMIPIKSLLGIATNMPFLSINDSQIMYHKGIIKVMDTYALSFPSVCIFLILTSVTCTCLHRLSFLFLYYLPIFKPYLALNNVTFIKQTYWFCSKFQHNTLPIATYLFTSCYISYCSMYYIYPARTPSN